MCTIKVYVCMIGIVEKNQLSEFRKVYLMKSLKNIMLQQNYNMDMGILYMYISC